MRRFILFLFAIVGCACVQAEDLADSDLSSDYIAVTDTVRPTIDYNAESLPDDWYKSTPDWRQYKKMSIVGWSMVGVGGASLATYGLFRWALHAYGDGPCSFESWELYYWIIPSAVLTLCGSAVLYDAFKHKKLAKQLSFSPAAVSMRVPGRAVSCAPGLSVHITF